MWEDDESDVKLKYRLQYGHVLIETHEIDLVIKKTRSSIRLRKPAKTFSKLGLECLPEQEGITVMNDKNNWHFVFAVFGLNTAVFAPHFLFFHSKTWKKVSHKLGVRLAIVDLHENYFWYTLFNDGKHICNAALEPEGIRQMKIGPMEFHLNGKMFHKVNEEKNLLTNELINFISSDVIIDIDENKQVRFKKPLSTNEYHEPQAVRHAIFAANKKLLKLEK